MANDFIKIDDTLLGARGAAQLKQLTRQMREAYNNAKQIRAMMTHQNNAVDFTPIEAYWGLPAGTGQSVFDLVNGAAGAMEGSFQVADCVTLTEKLG